MIGFLDRAADLLDERAEKEAVSGQHASDPWAWARDRLGVHLWSKQVEIAESVRDHRQTAVKSCHGVGKSFLAAQLVAWWLDIHPPGEARVVTTAPTGDQVKAILWSEINGAFAKAEARGTPFLGRINETDWKLGKRLIAFGRKPSDYNPHAFQGIHAKYVLVILDEACGINQQFWTAAKAIATGEHCHNRVMFKQLLQASTAASSPSATQTTLARSSPGCAPTTAGTRSASRHSTPPTSLARQYQTSCWRCSSARPTWTTWPTNSARSRPPTSPR